MPVISSIYARVSSRWKGNSSATTMGPSSSHLPVPGSHAEDSSPGTTERYSIFPAFLRVSSGSKVAVSVQSVSSAVSASSPSSLGGTRTPEET